MNDISIRLTMPNDTNHIKELMDKYWGGEPLVVRAKIYYPSRLEGVFALNKDEIIGYSIIDVPMADPKTRAERLKVSIVEELP